MSYQSPTDDSAGSTAPDGGDARVQAPARDGAAASEPGDEASLPSVSVIVPVYNDPAGVAETLDSLVSLTYPVERHEIIVVDNGSTDDTRDVVRRYAGEHDHVRLLVEDEIQGSYAARNRGIRHAEGSILSFVDADMWVEEDWLHAVVECFEDPDVEALGCDVQLHVPEDDRTLAGEYNARTDLDVERYVTELGFVPTCCLSVRRSVFEAVGLFDERFTSAGDHEFGHRLRRSGRTLYFADDIVMHHPARTRLPEVLKKGVRIGRGRAQRHLYYPERYGSALATLVWPGLYAPPSPFRAGRHVTGWSELSAGQWVAFFLLQLAIEVTKTAGHLHETLSAVGAGARRGLLGRTAEWNQ